MRSGRWLITVILMIACASWASPSASAQPTKNEPAKLADEKKKAEEAIGASIAEAKKSGDDGIRRGDTAWMLMSSALVFFMIPGLALFYGGMVRRKNILATMMQSMAALAVVGLYWIAIGYSLAFGPSQIVAPNGFLGVDAGGLSGWSWDLVFLQGIAFDKLLPGTNVSVLTHVMFQGMFAIITPALISGAIAERIRFWPFCIFTILWVTFVYCPLAHMVWAMDWFQAVPLDTAKGLGASSIGLLGKMGALDFAGGTVVHIAAGMAGLACVLVLRKRHGYPEQVAHPNSMVLTLLGAGFLWFGWFGFNGGSAMASTPLAASAFAATQAAAASAGLMWMLVEWRVKGKPTALGLASGIVAGLVAVTPASGYVYIWGAVAIGALAAVVCYFAVALKNRLGYDDSLDAFGVHGVGGIVGAILTGVFCTSMINGTGDGVFTVKWQEKRVAELEKDDKKPIADEQENAKAAPADSYTSKSAAENAAALQKELDDIREKIKARESAGKGPYSQLVIQLKAVGISVVFSFTLSLFLAILTQAMTLKNFTTDNHSEADGLDRTEHGEVGFDFGYATESVSVMTSIPRSALVPPPDGRFDLALSGASAAELMGAWSALCRPSDRPADPDFVSVYKQVTTVSGTRFRCRGGDPVDLGRRLTAVFKMHLNKEITAAKVG